MAKNNKRSPVRTEAVGEGLSMNGHRPINTFSVWRRQSTGWKGGQRVHSNFRRELGSETRVFEGVGRKFYLITPEDGEIVLEHIDGKFDKIKEPLRRNVEKLDRSMVLFAGGFKLSRPDSDGKKTVFLELVNEGEDAGPDKERKDLLKSSRAGRLDLPELAMAVEVAKVPAEHKRADVRPLVEEHMPSGMRLSFDRPLLTYTMAQPE